MMNMPILDLSVLTNPYMIIVVGLIVIVLIIAAGLAYDELR